MIELAGSALNDGMSKQLEDMDAHELEYAITAAMEAFNDGDTEYRDMCGRMLMRDYPPAVDSVAQIKHDINTRHKANLRVHEFLCRHFGLPSPIVYTEADALAQANS